MGEETVFSAFQLYQAAKRVMVNGGFNLRKWNSNSIELLQRIEQMDVHETEKSLIRQNLCDACIPNTDGNTPLSKLLGIVWDSKSDVFTFETNSLEQFVKKLNVSKRSLLRMTGVTKVLFTLDYFTKD